MTNIILVGQYADDGLLLEFMHHKAILRDNFIYQLKTLAGGGVHLRKLDSNLRDATVNEALENAGRIVTLQKLNSELENVISGRDYVALGEYLDEQEVDDSEKTLNLKTPMGYLPDVLNLIETLYKLGYNFGICSADLNLNRLMSLTRCRRRAANDFTLKFDICGDDIDIDIDKIWTQILNFARKMTSAKTYMKNLRDRFAAENLGRNIFRLEGNSGIYLSLTRQIRQLSREQNQFLRKLERGNEIANAHFCWRDMETVAYMLINEHLTAENIETLFSTRLVKIANFDDVIISFLGSRRCNLKCKYCFSDHTRAPLSTMTPNEFTNICDILTHDRPSARVHFDNNLGGEPTLDEKHVQCRHFWAIAYHKTTGTPATFGILTNGTNLKPRFLKWLKYHIPYVGFSLDGNKTTNDRIRIDAAGNPTYERAVRGIKMLQSADWRVNIGISGVITGYDTDIPAIQAHMREELKIPNVVLKPVRASQESDFALTYNDLNRLTRDYQRLFDGMLEAGIAGNLEPLFSTLQPLDYAGRFLLRIFWSDRLIVKRCGCAEHIFSVNDDGRVYPCDSFNGVREREVASLKEGFHNRNKFRVPFVTKENFGCAQCSLRYLCGGVCQYVQYLNKYQRNDVTRMECELAKFLITASLKFWQAARTCWSEEILEKVAEHINGIGYVRLNDGAMVYAPC